MEENKPEQVKEDDQSGSSEVPKTLSEQDPVELASMMLTVYTPRFRNKVDTLSSNQLRRVLKSIVEFPIGKTYKHTHPVENEVFSIGKSLLDAKYVLIADTYNTHREQILKQAAEAASKEDGNNQKEVNDGKEEKT